MHAPGALSACTQQASAYSSSRYKILCALPVVLEVAHVPSLEQCLPPAAAAATAAAAAGAELDGRGNLPKMKMLQKMRLLEEQGSTFATTTIKELKVFGERW
jgi:hypothetical protein